MDLSSRYLNLQLENPLVVAASNLSQSLDNIRSMEDYGAGAVVLYSLFEEQINQENEEIDRFLAANLLTYSEAAKLFPAPSGFQNRNGEGYLEHIRKAKEALSIPVIASLNGISRGGWVEFASKIEDAGADALELNIYVLATDPMLTSLEVEEMYIDTIHAIRSAISLPLSVKVAPFFSAFSHMAHKMTGAGADGLVLFNRFYQPDIDIETREVVPRLVFSSEFESRLPLRWIAILRDQLNCSLAATTGIREASGIIKAVMAGADVAMLASVLYMEGIDKIAQILGDMHRWFEEKEISSLDEIRGILRYREERTAAAYERSNYIKTLQSIMGQDKKVHAHQKPLI